MGGQKNKEGFKSTDNLTPEELELLGFNKPTDLPEVDSSAVKEVLPSINQHPKLNKEQVDVNSRTSTTEKENNSATIYSGDVKDTTGPISPTGQWEALNLKDPAQVVEIFDSAVNSGEVLLHPWQIEVSEKLGEAKPTSKHPFKFCLCACNGSGKDAYVIAPFVIWFALSKIQSLCIITSSSGVQLTAQTENYIRRLADAVNSHFGEPIFKINQRYIKCLKSGSEIRMFATDEAGKAEGYHPLKPNSEMAIIVNEAKSVAPEIFGALKRCTGFNYWLNVSTPGEPHGDFYDAFTNWPHKRHVTTYDCPHLSESEREDDRRTMGEHSALFRSKHLALFTSLGGQVIIPVELVDRILKNPPSPEHQDWPLRIGGDLAAGGDELVLTGVKGNRISRRVSFTQRDTVLATDIIEHHFLHTFKITKDHEHIYMDDGGVGRGIIDNLVRRGWKINRILNQSRASNNKEFGNRGAEAWFRAKRIIEEGLFDLRDMVDGQIDEKFKAQLTNRYYKQQSTQGRITLEAKKDAKAHGRPSPDRADSFLLALTGLTIDDFLIESTGVKSPTKAKSGGQHMTQEQLLEFYENQETFKNFPKPEDLQKSDYLSPKKKPLCGSLNAYFFQN